MEPFQAKMVAAAVGSTLTALTMTPFDVVKTRLQTQPPRQQPLFPNPPPNTCCQPNVASCTRQMSSLAVRPAAEEIVCVWDHGVFKTERVNGFADAFRHVWRAEGMRGLWKGAGTTWVIGVPSSTCYMLAYDHLLHVSLPPLLPESVVPLAAGVIARSSMTSLVSPLELIRTNLQSTPISASNPHTLRSVLLSVRELVREHGARHLWRGLGPTLWRDVPFSGLYWASYESWKKGFENRGLSGGVVAFASGAISGVTAAVFTSPFDVLKTRRQALVISGTTPQGVAVWPMLRNVVRTEGISALYAGIGPRIAKIAPACGIMIGCFEVRPSVRNPDAVEFIIAHRALQSTLRRTSDTKFVAGWKL
ncbi:mitochondrial carrier [Punctularia strigosozonata HHB-11173 SS5]|uniref:mitochondrial carrier n=1 Tax=Punctularia strigosozonata (strain HHB-11173) TaxID=741275 RepID=UPI0004418405|nr:mitochondrial carrier [Punctularia strigosozonata HHB-11173 SS5]EIN13684.1 mitochondrial carrier [Punctularia strigosozonata HHB-11173 SS5]